MYFVIFLIKNKKEQKNFEQLKIYDHLDIPCYYLIETIESSTLFHLRGSELQSGANLFHLNGLDFAHNYY